MYYYDNNNLIYKKGKELYTDLGAYFLERGDKFLRNATQRFNEPKFK